MRTKFRVWDKNDKRWLQNIHVDLDGNLFVASEEGYSEFYSSWLQSIELTQFTGLHDKNGLTEVWEGDIIDENGVVKGNIYESPQIFKEGIDFVIAGMGMDSWRNTESIAMGRGCKYSE